MLSSHVAHASRRTRTARMHRAFGAPIGLLSCLLLLAACGGSSSTGGASPTATATTAPTATTQPTAVATTPAASGAATISMASFSFSGPTNVTIKAGQSVTFMSNGTHELVIGMHGQFMAETGAPSELNSSSGVAFSPGDSKMIVFANAGTFHITCIIHPSMQANVTVTA
jgi:plastocyanin